MKNIVDNRECLDKLSWCFCKAFSPKKTKSLDFKLKDIGKLSCAYSDIGAELLKNIKSIYN